MVLINRVQIIALPIIIVFFFCFHNDYCLFDNNIITSIFLTKYNLHFLQYYQNKYFCRPKNTKSY